MSTKELRALLNLMMVSDPWPLEDGEQVLLIGLADAESRALGYDGWVVAYHELPQEHYAAVQAATEEAR